MRKRASYATHYSWQQISTWQTFDETDILPIEFLCRAAFYNMLRQAETVPKLHHIDIRTIFGICFKGVKGIDIVSMRIDTYRYL